jgi:hypothetical protein
MYRRSRESYIWIYGENSVIAVPAKRARYPKLPHDFTSIGRVTIGDLIADGLRCNKGDESLGRPLSRPTIDGMHAVMQRLATPRALSFGMHPELAGSRKR